MPNYMNNNVDAADFGRAWYELLDRLYHCGEPSSPRDQATRELIGVRLHVDDMTQNILLHPERALNFRFMVAEWLWIAAARNDAAFINRYNRRVAEMSSDDGVTLAGAYGPRLAPQLDYLLSTLRQKADSRQAVATIWTPNPEPSRDVPCTVSWQLLLRHGKLHAVVTMRSSDIWLGLPYDFFNFSMLTMGLAGELEVEPGSITFNLGSSHLYNRDQVGAIKVLDDPGGIDTLNSPRLPGRPPAEAIIEASDLNYSRGFRFGDLWDTYLKVLTCQTSAMAMDILTRHAVGRVGQ
jgi:thymidylate synthase